MKKVIDRKVYNTETAEEIANWSNSVGRTDFSHCEETLYKTKGGRYFLHGEGGPMSKYSVSCGQNSWSGGSDIVPMSENEAIDWLEETGCVSELEEYFPDALEEA